jgi:hypothetical protein
MLTADVSLCSKTSGEKSVTLQKSGGFVFSIILRQQIKIPLIGLTLFRNINLKERSKWQSR